MKRLIDWVPVDGAKPECSRTQGAPFSPVLVWPRNTDSHKFGLHGFCHYGRMGSSKPQFYKHNVIVTGVTHWAYMPDGPTSKGKK